MAERCARPRRTRSQPSPLQPARDFPREPRGQHFLKSRRLTAELVHAAEVSRRDLVIEVGAGRGKITAELEQRAGRILAIERDPALARHLIERFGGDPRVLVVVGDALDFPWPSEPFRVFANPPFGITAALLRKLLDDPALLLRRADLVVQEGLAIKRTRRLPSHLLNLTWGPWWRFEVTRRIPAKAFEPMPSVDAAMLSIRRRNPPLLSDEQRLPFLGLLQKAFGRTVPISMLIRRRLPRSDAERLLDEVGIRQSSKPSEVDLHSWLAIFLALTKRLPARPG